MKPKLLYIMGIDWNWIYQRPQILAERLSEDYEVTVVFPRSIIAKKENVTSKVNLRFRILWTLPFQEKNNLIGGVAKFINRHVFDDINMYSLIYIGYPLYARYIPSTFGGRIVYDCMDDYDSLYPDQKRVSIVNEYEEKLIRSCDLVFASSVELEKKVNLIAAKEKAILIRNAADIRKLYLPKEPLIKQQYILAYIGTIASWFDNSIIEKSLEKEKNIQYLLVGPGPQIINNPKVKFLGRVEHENLYDVVKDVDCLIMPFMVNDVVKFVDPVKLYEYIAFGKCIISIYYEEIKRFEEYVYFYRDADEYCALVEDLALKGFPAKYDKDKQKSFIRDNTWDKRYEVIKKELKTI